MKLDRRLLSEAWAARLALVATVALGLLAGVAVVGQARFLSLAVSRVFLGGQGLAQVASLLLAFLFLSLSRAGLVWGAEVAAQRLADRAKQAVRDRLLTHLLALGPIYARDERSGELANTLAEGVEALDAYYRRYLPQLALAALVPLALLLFVLPLDWISGLVLLLTAPLIPLFMVLVGSAAEALTRRQWTTLSRLSAHFFDVLQGLATLKHLGRSRAQLQVIARIGDRYRQATMGVLRVTFLSALILELVATISTAVVAVQVGLRLLYGQIAFQEAFFILILAPEFYLPLRLLGGRFHAGMEGVAAAARIYEVLEAPLPSARPAQVRPAPDARDAARGALAFRDVRYAYAGWAPALDGLSFQIEPGETVALVGPSGGGKTTVAYLLLRFLAPDGGVILAGGTPLADLPPDAWRQSVAWVPQQPYLFYGTVAHNIRLARPGATTDEVVWAARQARAHAFIEELPRGYDTVVGERGARLSGGQAQRLALARALLKDAPLLILDEATANLDPEVETLIQEGLGRLLQRRTALVIAHRLPTIYRADRILVLDGGRLVEQGSHAALLQRRGLYRRLVRAYNPGGGP
ncbi:MAG: thiol reductant ABC exporter subunit CydD [Anaerolineae bacterium]